MSYERPREKLRNRGARALSTVELIQIVVGSGGKKVSAARIAKTVSTLVHRSEVLKFEDLLDVGGLGFAKSAQILAAIELGGRLNTYHKTSPLLVTSDFDKVISSSRRTLQYISINGANERINYIHEDISDISKATLAIRKMFANALRNYALSLTVGVGSRSQPTDSLDAELLKIIKMIFDTASLLEIKVDSVWLVSKDSHQEFRRKALL